MTSGLCYRRASSSILNISLHFHSCIHSCNRYSPSVLISLIQPPANFLHQPPLILIPTPLPQNPKDLQPQISSHPSPTCIAPLTALIAWCDQSILSDYCHRSIQRFYKRQPQPRNPETKQRPPARRGSMAIAPRKDRRRAARAGERSVLRELRP